MGKSWRRLFGEWPTRDLFSWVLETFASTLRRIWHVFYAGCFSLLISVLKVGFIFRGIFLLFFDQRSLRSCRWI